MKGGVALDVADTGLGSGDQQPAHDAGLFGQHGQVQRGLADVVLDVEPGAGRAADQLGRDLDVLVDDGQMEVPGGDGENNSSLEPFTRYGARASVVRGNPVSEGCLIRRIECDFLGFARQLARPWDRMTTFERGDDLSLLEGSLQLEGMLIASRSSSSKKRLIKRSRENKL